MLESLITMAEASQSVTRTMQTDQARTDDKPAAAPYMPVMTSSLIHLPQRAVLSLTGPDTITLLERLVTHATNDWWKGETRYGALLTPQGKIIADYLAVRTEDGVLMDVAREQVGDLAKRLKMFRLRSQVDIEVLDDLTVRASTEAADRSAPVSNAMVSYLDPRYPNGRLRAVAKAERSTAPDVPDQIAAYHADRIANAIPEQGLDFGAAEVFPSDINMDWLGGVALNKGCFVGQEVVSRMHRRGKIRKRTLKIELPADLAAEPGTDLVAPQPIGTLTSRHGNQALALIRIDRLQKALSDQVPVRLNESSVTIVRPDWLAADLAAMDSL